MKRAILTTLCVLAILAGLAVSAVAPWWAVLFICLPVMWAGAVIILKLHTDWIWNA